MKFFIHEMKDLVRFLSLRFSYGSTTASLLGIHEIKSQNTNSLLNLERKDEEKIELKLRKLLEKVC